jgi:hypothetical protein
MRSFDINMLSLRRKYTSLQDLPYQHLQRLRIVPVHPGNSGGLAVIQDFVGNKLILKGIGVAQNRCLSGINE